MANYYVTISPIDTLSTSTYSIYFDEIKYSNLMLSGVPQSTLVGGLLVYFTGSAASATSVYVKNEDPDCCCAVQSYILPTPSPTTSPTTAAPTTASPTTPQPTTPNPTTPQPTTPQPTTPNPTTPTPTAATTKVFSAWSFVSGYDNYLGTSSGGTIYGWTVGTSGTTIITGTLVITGGSENISVCAAAAATSELVSATCTLAGTTTYNFSVSDNTAGSPVCEDLVVAPGTYTVTLRGTFGTNSSTQSVYIN